MKEVIVRSEFDHSYLLIENYNLESGYKWKMLTQNKIPGLLECKVRYIEDKSYYSYEITSKKSLEQEYADKKMHFDDLVDLFYGIHRNMCRSNEYLLENKDFWLYPQYIFKDLETEELFCLCYPQKEQKNGTKQEQYRALADFILDKIDHKDEHAVNIAYHFYKLSKEEFFSFETFVNFLEKETLMVKAEERREKRKLEETGGWIQEVGAGGEKEEEAEEIFSTEKEELVLIEWWILGILFLLGIALIAGYCFVPILKKYTLYILLPGLLLVALAIILMVRNVILYMKKEKESMYEETMEPVRVEEYFDDALDDVTVFFDKEEYLCLKWKEGHFSKEYVLEKFPVTIGKLKESVQVEIKDASISRLHARLRKQRNIIYLQDLDSTNGTFINGKRLVAGEDAIIKRGDEIQFGKIIVNVV